MTIINKGRSPRSALKQVRLAFQTAQTSLPDRPRSDHAKLKPSPVAEPHLGVTTRTRNHPTTQDGPAKFRNSSSQTPVKSKSSEA
jgi:hypothetical protein